MTRQQWDEMPWHDQRMYIEQLNEDPEYNEDAESDSGSGGGSSQELTSWDQLPPAS